MAFKQNSLLSLIFCQQSARWEEHSGCFVIPKVIPENNKTYKHHLTSYNYIPTNTSPPITDLILTNRFHRAAAARIPPWIPMRKRCGPCALPTGDLLWDQRWSEFHWISLDISKSCEIIDCDRIVVRECEGWQAVFTHHMQVLDH